MWEPMTCFEQRRFGLPVRMEQACRSGRDFPRFAGRSAPIGFGLGEQAAGGRRRRSCSLAIGVWTVGGRNLLVDAPLRRRERGGECDDQHRGWWSPRVRRRRSVRMLDAQEVPGAAARSTVSGRAVARRRIPPMRSNDPPRAAVRSAGRGLASSWVRASRSLRAAASCPRSHSRSDAGRWRPTPGGGSVPRPAGSATRHHDR